MNADEVENKSCGNTSWKKQKHKADEKYNKLQHMGLNLLYTLQLSPWYYQCLFHAQPPEPKLHRRDWNCCPEAFHDLNQKVDSPAFQLILLLLIPAGLKLLSLDARPTDRDYHSSSDSQGILNSMTQVRLNHSR